MGVSITVPTWNVPSYSMYTASVTGGTAWTQLVASTSSTIFIVGFAAYIAISNGTFAVATGAAGSEVPIFTHSAWLARYDAVVTGLTYPIRVPAGTRLAARLPDTQNVSILYVTEASVR